MIGLTKTLGRGLSNIFVPALLCASIATNVLLIHRSYWPIWAQDWRQAHVTVPGPRSTDPATGPSNAPITIIEYSDFQCPYCAGLQAQLWQAAHQVPIHWIFRFYTLNSGHPQATAAAEAAECAGEQGKFWLYANYLFANQAHLGPELYATLAKTTGLNINTFSACYSSRRYQSVIAADSNEAKAIYLLGTPTWFVNGKRVTGNVSQKRLRSLLAGAG